MVDLLLGMLHASVDSPDCQWAFWLWLTHFIR